MADLNLTIRPATEADVDTLVGFTSQIALHASNLVLDPATARAGVSAVVTDINKGRLYVGEIDGEVVAQIMVTYEWSDWNAAFNWWVQSVYTRPEHRRKGIFRTMYLHVKEEARKAGCCGVKLYANVNNTGAHAAYRALGMESHDIVFEDMLE